MATAETEQITGELVSNQIEAPIIFSVTNEDQRGISARGCCEQGSACESGPRASEGYRAKQRSRKAHSHDWQEEEDWQKFRGPPNSLESKRRFNHPESHKV